MIKDARQKKYRKVVDGKRYSIYVGAGELEEIEKAARLQGESLNGFLINAALEKVAWIAAEQSRQTLQTATTS